MSGTRNKGAAEYVRVGLVTSPDRPRIPTLEEMRDWYTGIRRLPGGRELRDHIYRGLPWVYPVWIVGGGIHGTDDGLVTLCGTSLDDREVSYEGVVHCQKCGKIIENNDLRYDP